MTDLPQPVPLFATPADGKALLDYMELFSGDEREAAQIGFANFGNKNFDDVIVDMEPATKLVAIVVAGMRWNLYCKDHRSAQDVTERHSEQG